MPFEVGHTINNGRKRDKPYAAALHMEIKAAAEADNPHKALRAVARAHLRKAAAGDMAAITELANRLDGKVPQAVVGDDEHPPAFQAWLAWMTILNNANDIKDITPPLAVVGDNGQATRGSGVPCMMCGKRSNTTGCDCQAPAGADLVPSEPEETSAP